MRIAFANEKFLFRSRARKSLLFYRAIQPRMTYEAWTLAKLLPNCISFK